MQITLGCVVEESRPSPGWGRKQLDRSLSSIAL